MLKGWTRGLNSYRARASSLVEFNHCWYTLQEEFSNGRDRVFAILRERQADLKQRGVKTLAVFGSVARGEASAESDLDVLVELEHPVGLFDFIRLKNELENLMGCRVDLVTPDALHPRLRERILKEAVYVQ